MKYIGLDIGTTTISGVVADTETASLSDSQTIPNDTWIPSANTWEKIQDPEGIFLKCRDMLLHFRENHPDIAGIGFTGQMHGVLYLDASGEAVSPLATWQDERCNLECEGGVSYCDYITRTTGYPSATGFGLATHFYDERNGKTPEKAASLCTIADYVALRLCGNAEPLIHASNAAGLSLFDIGNHRFDMAAVSALDLRPSILPRVADGEPIIGRTGDGIPVVIPIGDNQASYAGSVGFGRDILVNIGTGSQISLAGDRLPISGELEYRPFIGGKYLLTGSGLCGGRSFQLLRDFFAEAGTLLGGERDANIYGILEECARQAKALGNELIADTRFRGSRRDPQMRGAIQNIGIDNFTPGHLSLGILRGIVGELFSHYENMPGELKRSGRVVGSGNTVRKTGLLQQLLSEAFRKDVKIPLYKEEAAYGAALLAMCAVENRPYEAMGDFIPYL